MPGQHPGRGVTGLTDALRERLSRRGRTARADCGALGVLTMEALSPGDCAALLRGSGGERALVYAACRELQQAGEALRREGRVFTPEEIMEYIGGEELSGAVETVLALSGLPQRKSPLPQGRAGAASGTSPAPSRPASARTGTEDGRGEAPRWTEGSAAAWEDFSGGSGDGKAPFEKAGAASLEGAASIEALPQAGTGAGERRTERSGDFDGGGGGEAENRLESVQDFCEAVPEIRQDFVRAQEDGTEAFPASEASRNRKIRQRIVREAETPPEAEPPRKEKIGQVSHEAESHSAGFRQKSWTDKKPQAFGTLTGNQTQNVAKVTGISPASGGGLREDGGAFEKAARVDGPELLEGAHETTSEFRSEAHETTSEFPEFEAAGVHETESEFREKAHETTSEFQEKAHEVKSEFSEFGAAGMHEARSDFGETAHEDKSEPAGERAAKRVELPEMTEALAERAAEYLLEGLRRAAGAR